MVAAGSQGNALVSVLLPVRNGADFITDQLDGLARQRCDWPWELVVVDDGSTDSTRSIVDTYKDRIPNLRCVGTGGRGLSAARNLGVSVANGDLIVSCDADDVVADGWLNSMVVALGKFDVVGGTRELAQLNSTDRYGDVEQLPALQSSFGRRPFACGATIGFRRSAFDAVAGFDEQFTSSFDDVDFCWRVQYAGLSIGAAEGAVVHYRLRGTIVEFLRHAVRRTVAEAQGKAKHQALGAIPRTSRAREMQRAVYLVGWLLARAPKLLDARTRWNYLHNVGRLWGASVGLVRSGVFVA